MPFHLVLIPHQVLYAGSQCVAPRCIRVYENMNTTFTGIVTVDQTQNEHRLGTLSEYR